MLAGIISNLEGDKIINMLLTLWISVLAVLRKKTFLLQVVRADGLKVEAVPRLEKLVNFLSFFAAVMVVWLEESPPD